MKTQNGTFGLFHSFKALPRVSTIRVYKALQYHSCSVRSNLPNHLTLDFEPVRSRSPSMSVRRTTGVTEMHRKLHGPLIYSSHMLLLSCLPTLPLCHATKDQRSTSTCASPVFTWLRYHRLLYIVYVDPGFICRSRGEKNIPETLLDLIQCWCKGK